MFYVKALCYEAVWWFLTYTSFEGNTQWLAYALYTIASLTTLLFVYSFFNKDCYTAMRKNILKYSLPEHIFSGCVCLPRIIYTITLGENVLAVIIVLAMTLGWNIRLKGWK